MKSLIETINEVSKIKDAWKSDSNIAKGDTFFTCYLAANADNSIYLFCEEPKRNEEQGVWESDKTSILVSKDSKSFERGFSSFRRAKNMNKVSWKNNPMKARFTHTQDKNYAEIHIGIRDAKTLYILDDEMRIISYKDCKFELDELDIYKKMFDVRDISLNRSDSFMFVRIEK